MSLVPRQGRSGSPSVGACGKGQDKPSWPQAERLSHARERPEGVTGVAHGGKVSDKVVSPRRTPEPLDTEGPSPPVLSTFLPPVPSTALDPPEHFPLRKTGKALGTTTSPSRRFALATHSQWTAGAGKGAVLAPQSQPSFSDINDGAGTNPLICWQRPSPT